MRVGMVVAPMVCLFIGNGCWNLMAEAQREAPAVTYQVTVHSGSQVATLPIRAKEQFRQCFAREGFHGLTGEAAVHAALTEALQKNLDNHLFSLPVLQQRHLTVARGKDTLPYDPYGRCSLISVEDWVISAC